jgi:hypothetical protein
MPNIVVFRKDTLEILKNYWLDETSLPTSDDANKAYAQVPFGYDPDRITIQRNIETEEYDIVQDSEVENQRKQFLINIIRQERNIKLQQTDWMFCSDSILTQGKREQWAHYRQLLRDLPNSIGSNVSDDVVWPSPPGHE